MSGVQYEVHIQHQPDVKAKLDIVYFQCNQFSGWSVSNRSARKYEREKSQKSKFSYNGDFNFENTLLFIKTESKVTSLE